MTCPPQEEEDVVRLADYVSEIADCVVLREKSRCVVFGIYLTKGAYISIGRGPTPESTLDLGQT